MIWKSSLNQRIAQIADFITVISSYFISYFLCYQLIETIHTEKIPANWLLIVLVLGFVYVVLFEFNKAYNFQRFTSLKKEYQIVAKISVIGFLLGILLFYMIGQRFIPSRTVLSITFLIIVILLGIEKTMMFWIARMARKKSQKKRVVIVGIGAEARKLLITINENVGLGLNVIGFVSLKKVNPIKDIMNKPIVGDSKDFEYVLKKYNPEEVIIAIQSNKLGDIQNIFETCEKVGIQVRLISDFFKYFIKNIRIDHIYGLNIISFHPTYRSDFDRFLKRFIDCLVSLIALIVLSPFFLCIALIIQVSDGSPVFFRWKIMGYNRNPIISWKFRSMSRDADELKKKLLEKNEMTGPMFKMKQDPRILPFGRFLRKYSIDELPQLISVLKGDLSLVGPRPPLQYEFEKFDLWHRRKLSVKPGLTCLWQVSGRNDIKNFDDWAKLDLEYIDNWSHWLDFKIFCKTFIAIFKGSGK